MEKQNWLMGVITVFSAPKINIKKTVEQNLPYFHAVVVDNLNTSEISFQSASSTHTANRGIITHYLIEPTSITTPSYLLLSDNPESTTNIAFYCFGIPLPVFANQPH